jgi:hypothetical protein
VRIVVDDEKPQAVEVDAHHGDLRRAGDSAGRLATLGIRR